jgi:anti-sigma factor RsiW
MKPECSHYEELILREVDEGLDAGLSEKLGAHMRACEDCRQRGEEYARLVGAVRNAAPPEPCPEFWARFHTRLDASIAEKAREPRGWFRAGPFAAFALTAALAFAVVTAPWRPPMPSSDSSTAAVGIDQLFAAAEQDNLSFVPYERIEMVESGTDDPFMAWMVIDDDGDSLAMM